MTKNVANNLRKRRIAYNHLKARLLVHTVLSEEYNSQIEKIATMISEDRVSLDEQDLTKLEKYYSFARKHFHIEGESVVQLVNEAFLYLKLKSSDFVDPLQHGDEFGAGFS